jgi:phage host-nuclease inhibitor protein Gam
MSRRAIRLLAALLLAAPAAAAPVPPKGDDSLAPSALWLLKHRRVQQELKMPAEQRIAVIDALADIDEGYNAKLDAMAAAQDVPDDTIAKLDADRAEATRKVLAAAAKNLTAAQRARLRQLDWRVRGPAAFADPRVGEALKLTPAQLKKAADAAAQSKEAVARYIDEVGDESEARQKEKLFAARKARWKEVEDGLTADQKKLWAELIGSAPSRFAEDELWLRVVEDPDEPPEPAKDK